MKSSPAVCPDQWPGPSSSYSGVQSGDLIWKLSDHPAGVYDGDDEDYDSDDD